MRAGQAGSDPDSNSYALTISNCYSHTKFDANALGYANIDSHCQFDNDPLSISHLDPRCNPAAHTRISGAFVRGL